MSNSKYISFVGYLTEIMVSDDPVQAIQDVRRASRNMDRYKKEQRMQNMDDQRDIQKSDDPNKMEKMRIFKLRQQAATQEKRLADKAKRTEQQMGIQTDTGERPATGNV